MKKILFVLVAVVAMSFVSCGNKVANTASANDSDSVAVLVDSVDTVAVDSVVCTD